MNASQRSLLVLLAVLAGGAAAGAWWLRRQLQAPEAATVEPSLDSGPAALAEPERTGVAELAAAPDDVDSTDTTVAWPVQIDLRLVAAAIAPSTDDLKPIKSGANASLSGRIIGPRGEGVAATLRIVGGPNAGRELAANADGAFGATDLLPGLGFAEVRGPGTPGALRQVRLRQGVDFPLNVSFAHPVQVWVTVHDDAGAPLAGAEVRLDGQRAVSDDFGDVYFPAMTPGLNLAIEIEKQGFATYGGLVGISIGYDLPKGKLQYRMSRACRLEVVVPDGVGGKGEALVYAMPDNPMSQGAAAGYAPGGHPVSPMDYPWHRASPKSVAAGGRAVFDDLPEQRVVVRVFHEGAVAEPDSLVVNLRPDKPSTLTVAMKPGPKIQGHVSLDGEPAAGARVVLEVPDRTSTTLQYFAQSPAFLESMPVPSVPVAYQQTASDDEGNFVLTAWPQFARATYLHATSRDGRAFAGLVVREGTEQVELELEPIESGTATLEIEFPSRIQALPVAVRIDGKPEPERAIPASQNLVLEGLAAGTWTLSARWNGQELASASEPFELAGTTLRSVSLPEGAILGQDADTLSRARGEFD